MTRALDLVVGIGCTRGTPADVMQRGLEHVLAAHGLSATSVRALASIDHKRDEAGLQALSARNGWPLALYSAAQLVEFGGISYGSVRVATHVATPAVAEPAACLRAGTRALVVPKTVYREEGGSLTLAIACLAASEDGGVHG